MKLPTSSFRSINPFVNRLFALGLVLGITTTALTAVAQTQIDLPPQSSPFSGNVRGYWFTAPKDFAITGLEVPTDANPGNQSIAVLRLTAEPPLFSATTNDFEVLFLTQNDLAPGMIPVYIEVSAGDVIGVLGGRGDVNSYGTGSYVSSIDGLPITLERLGMQFPLSTTAPQEIWTEAGGSISRVRLFYGPIVIPNVGHPTLVKEIRKRKLKKKQRLSDKVVRSPRAVTPH